MLDFRVNCKTVLRYFWSLFKCFSPGFSEEHETNHLLPGFDSRSFPRPVNGGRNTRQTPMTAPLMGIDDCGENRDFPTCNVILESGHTQPGGSIWSERFVCFLDKILY